MPPTEKPNLLELFKGMLDDHLGKAEFIKSFQNIISSVKRFETKLTDDFQNLSSTLLSKLDTYRSDFDTFKAEVSATISSKTAHLSDVLSGKIKEIDDKLATVQDGADADEQQIVKDVLAQIKLPEQKEIILDNPEEIRNKLELLQGEERLDKSAIKGFDELEKSVTEAKSIRISPGRSLLQLYVDGSKKGAIQYLNLIAGTGITLSYNQAYGRNDVTITATGTASLSPIAVTGTVDDSNTSFTAASTPNLVIVNGASYRHGHGVTISGTSITLDNPVGTNGDIYAL